MSKLFENEKNLEREERAIKLWTRNLPQGSYKKLGGFDIDFRVYSPTTDTYAYVEVKGRHTEYRRRISFTCSCKEVSEDT